MKRRLSSFTKTTFESLERLVKLDSLNLANDKHGEIVLNEYEAFLRTHSQSTFIPKCLYSKVIQSTGSFNCKSVDFSDLKSQLKKVNPQSPGDQLFTLLSNESFDIKDIKSAFLSRNYSKNYYPPELRSTKLAYLHNKLEVLIEEVCKNFCVLGVSNWNKIMENILFIFNFYKPVGFLSFDESILKSSESQMIKILKKSDLLEISKFINFIHFLYPKYQLPSEVFEHFQKSCTDLDNLEDSELIQVLVAAPDNFKNDELLGHYNKLILKYDLIPFADLVNLVNKMAKFNLSFPVGTFDKIEKSIDLILEKNNFERNLEYLRPLLGLKLISKNALEYICENFSKAHSSEFKSKPVLYDLYTILFDTGNLQMVLNNDSLLYSIFQVSPFLSIDKQLKVLIGLIHHLKDFSLLEPYIERFEHTDLSSTTVNQSLLEKLLSEIFLFSEEIPIFQYQFTSYKIVEHDQLKRLTKVLKNVLVQIDSASPLLYKYFNSNLSDEQPPEDFINTVKYNNKEWAKLLWRMKDLYNLKDAALLGLRNIDYSEIDPEYLYYLSSVAVADIDLSKVPESDYSLAIMYNVKRLPQKYQKKVNFINLVTEAQVKTIIMLQRLNEYSQINKATEFLGFMPMAHPDIPTFVLQDLIKSLSSLNKSYINYYAVSCLINKSTKILTNEDFLTLDRFFYGNAKSIHPELEEKMSLIKVEDVYDREKFLNDCRTLMDQVKNGQSGKDQAYELKKLFDMKFLFKQNILDVIKNERFGHLNINLLKMILSIMTETQPDEEILTELVSKIEENQIWNQLDFEAQCNFFLISTKTQLFCPNLFKDNFLSSIYARSESESLNIHPKNGLSHYKCFKYTTILEPRHLISNNIHTKATLAEFSDRPEIPDDLAINNLKALSYLNHFNLQRTSEQEESIRLYFRKKNENNNFYNNKLSIFEDLSQIFKENEIQENFTEFKTYWVIDFLIQSKNLAINILCENDFYIDENLNTQVSLLQEVAGKQLEKIAGLKVLNIDFKQWQKFSQLEKENFFKEKTSENR